MQYVGQRDIKKDKDLNKIAMFSSAKDEHKHDRSPDHQIDEQAGDQAFVKQEQRCVHQVF